MGRHLRTWVPMADSKLIPQWSYLPEFKASKVEFRTNQKDNFDKHHCAHDLPPMPDNTRVWIEIDNGPTSGHVISMAETPRSYIIETSTSQLQRNRHHVLELTLTPMPNPICLNQLKERQVNPLTVTVL